MKISKEISALFQIYYFSTSNEKKETKTSLLIFKTSDLF